MRQRDEEVIASISGRTVARSGWVRGNCPFCPTRIGKEDRSLSLGLNTHTGDWHCFRCEARGLVQALPDDIELRRPAQRASVEVVPLALPEGFIPLFGGGARDVRIFDARFYMVEERGLPKATLVAARVGVVLDRPPEDSEAPNLAGRVVVPIFAPDDRTIVGWSARQWASRWGPKYLYPEGFDRQVTLYNSIALQAVVHSPVFVVEGVIDALALWPDAVACLGKPSDGQIGQLLESRRPIVVVLDGDAWRGAEALALKLKLFGLPCGWIRLAPTTDPGTHAKVVRALAPIALRDGFAEAA